MFNFAVTSKSSDRIAYFGTAVAQEGIGDVVTVFLVHVIGMVTLAN